MPGNSTGYRSFSPHLEITARAHGREPGRVQLYLAGEIDKAADDMLLDCLSWLTTRSPTTVLIDLAGVTFAGAALPNFVARTSGALSAEIDLILCSANPMTERVLRVTDMADIATITTDSPRSL